MLAVTVPDVAPMLATAGVLLVHVPTPVASPSVDVNPWHTLNVPSIGVGATFTVTTRVATQTGVEVNVMADVPAATPLTFPEPSTVATVLSLLLHVPEPAASASVVPVPAQNIAVPVIAGILVN